jgi:ketosteroid isomerase-like protein
MSSTTDSAEIEALFQQLAKAHADHDADAIVEAYAPDAVIYDLAPPLGRRGMNRDSVTAWLAGWQGPIQMRCARCQSYGRGRLGVRISVQQNARAPRR